MQKGDAIILNSVINKDLKLQTVFANKEGKRILRNENKEAFLTAVSTKKTYGIWFEKILSYTIKTDENLASV